MGFVRELPSFGICVVKATELLKLKLCSQNNQFLYNQSDTATTFRELETLRNDVIFVFIFTTIISPSDLYFP